MLPFVIPYPNTCEASSSWSELSSIAKVLFADKLPPPDNGAVVDIVRAGNTTFARFAPRAVSIASTASFIFACWLAWGTVAESRVSVAVGLAKLSILLGYEVGIVFLY